MGNECGNNKNVCCGSNLKSEFQSNVLMQSMGEHIQGTVRGPYTKGNLEESVHDFEMLKSRDQYYNPRKENSVMQSPDKPQEEFDNRNWDTKENSLSNKKNKFNSLKKPTIDSCFVPIEGNNISTDFNHNSRTLPDFPSITNEKVLATYEKLQEFDYGDCRVRKSLEPNLKFLSMEDTGQFHKTDSSNLRRLYKRFENSTFEGMFEFTSELNASV